MVSATRASRAQGLHMRDGDPHVHDNLLTLSLLVPQSDSQRSCLGEGNPRVLPPEF
jgi:hypothetical protein